jgi:hypothetical protein
LGEKIGDVTFMARNENIYDIFLKMTSKIGSSGYQFRGMVVDASGDLIDLNKEKNLKDFAVYFFEKYLSGNFKVFYFCFVD